MKSSIPCKVTVTHRAYGSYSQSYERAFKCHVFINSSFERIQSTPHRFKLEKKQNRTEQTEHFAPSDWWIILLKLFFREIRNPSLCIYRHGNGIMTRYGQFWSFFVSQTFSFGWGKNAIKFFRWCESLMCQCVDAATVVVFRSSPISPLNVYRKVYGVLARLNNYVKNHPVGIPNRFPIALYSHGHGMAFFTVYFTIFNAAISIHLAAFIIVCLKFARLPIEKFNNKGDKRNEKVIVQKTKM